MGTFCYRGFDINLIMCDFVSNFINNPKSDIAMANEKKINITYFSYVICFICYY